MTKQKSDEAHPAISFLRSLYALTPGGLVELRAISNDKAAPPRRIFARTPTDLVEFAEKYGQKDSKYGVYFGICKRERQDGTKKSIVRVPALWVDVDTVKNGWDTDELIKRVHSIPGVLRPTACVRSGGGLHLYWFLKEPGFDQKTIEAANVVLRDIFAGDACQNVDRIFRLPGTWNTKRRPAKKVEVVWCYEFDRVAHTDLVVDAQLAKMWIGERGDWETQTGVRRKLTNAAVLLKDPMDAFADLYGNGSRSATKNIADMWNNRVRYTAPRGYIGIHEAALRHTALAYIANKDMKEDAIVDIVMRHIQQIKDRDAPVEQWDMKREAETVRNMWRTWQPKWREYVNEQRRQSTKERNKNGGADGLRSTNRRVQGTDRRRSA